MLRILVILAAFLKLGQTKGLRTAQSVRQSVIGEFVCCVAANEAHWVRFLTVWNQTISLVMAIDHRHDVSHSVERRIRKLFVPLHSRESILDFQRFYTKRDSGTPIWGQAVSKDSLVAFYGGMRFWVDRF